MKTGKNVSHLQLDQEATTSWFGHQTAATICPHNIRPTFLSVLPDPLQIRRCFQTGGHRRVYQTTKLHERRGRRRTIFSAAESSTEPAIK